MGWILKTLLKPYKIFALEVGPNGFLGWLFEVRA